MNPPKIAFNFLKSDERIREILDAPAGSFDDSDSIPADDAFTYANGFYVNCSALMIDIRESTGMSSIHSKPVLAKIFRAFASECIAVCCSNDQCIELSLRGDGLLAVYDTPKKAQIDFVLDDAARLVSTVKLLNYRLSKKGYSEIKVGIGLDYGRALVVKSGFSGSGINDKLWVGDVVNRAVKLSGFGSKTLWDKPVMATEVFVSNLKETYHDFFNWNYSRACYETNVVNSAMNEWFIINCR